EGFRHQALRPTSQYHRTHHIRFAASSHHRRSTQPPNTRLEKRFASRHPPAISGTAYGTRRRQSDEARRPASEAQYDGGRSSGGSQITTRSSNPDADQSNQEGRHACTQASEQATSEQATSEQAKPWRHEVSQATAAAAAATEAVGGRPSGWLAAQARGERLKCARGKVGWSGHRM
ncbi:hypothetical protein BC567DRAFT_288496, partial [Phyllosticta citribraziliensis]